MMIDILKKYTNTIDLLERLTGPVPTSLKVSFNVVYLGAVQGDLFHVVIREEDAKLGWLYSEAHIVLFYFGDHLYYRPLKELKEYSEKQLSKKTFIDKECVPIPNVLRKGTDSYIEGFLPMQEVISNSILIE